MRPIAVVADEPLQLRLMPLIAAVAVVVVVAVE